VNNEVGTRARLQQIDGPAVGIRYSCTQRQTEAGTATRSASRAFGSKEALKKT
jgi:hypothetical protein